MPSRIIAQFRVLDERTGHVISTGDVPVSFNTLPEPGKKIKIEFELEFRMPMVDLLLDGKPGEFHEPNVPSDIEVRMIEVNELPS